MRIDASSRTVEETSPLRGISEQTKSDGQDVDLGSARA